MKVNLNLEKNTCTVTKESNDKKFSKGGWGAGLPESKFFHRVKAELIEQGFDVIKKRMSSDGCMVDDIQQWIRTRDFVEGEKGFALYNHRWAIEDLGEEFNSLKIGESLYVWVYRG